MISTFLYAQKFAREDPNVKRDMSSFPASSAAPEKYAMSNSRCVVMTSSRVIVFTVLRGSGIENWCIAVI